MSATDNSRADALTGPYSNRHLSVGDWLWCELMDYCKERGTPPSGSNRLFEIVNRARAAWDCPVEQHEAAPADDAREPSNGQTVSRNSITLSGAQLLEALDFIAPDRDADQLESEVTIERGTGHSGDGMYCWSTEYPEEGAILLDGTAPAQPEPPAADERAVTPSAKWRVDGEPDPHGTRYDCERAALTLGTLTDDELANAVFMHGNERPPIQDVIAGTAFMPIVYLTAAKERIRWLSRALEAARASSPNAAGAEGDSHLRAIMERDAWRAAMQKLCTKWCTTPDDAADHLRERLKSRAPRTDVAGGVTQWQYRIVTPGYEGDWHNCKPETAARLKEQPYAEDHQVRALREITQPPSADAAAAPADAQAVEGATFQARVQPWMLACFGAEIAADRAERNHRFLEEALELVQACGCTASEAHQLVDYTFGRPVGEPSQEVGGVMVTLAALCLANGLDMHMAGETELTRVWTKVEQIRAKQAAKPKHSPLPEAPAQAAEPVVSSDGTNTWVDEPNRRVADVGTQPDGATVRCRRCGEQADITFSYAAPPPPAPASAPVGLTDDKIDAIMDQAQVFASAWSMIGGVFDHGDAQCNAEQERADLRALLEGAKQ
ncbi:hypothetical protein ACVBR5_000871 [Burkholderia cenocepacia]